MDGLDDTSRPLDALCAVILDRYHASLHRTLPRIRDELTALSAEDDSREVAMMRVAFGELSEQIENHLSKEQHLLFPALVALAEAEREQRARPSSAFVTVLHPIRMMEAEHGRIEASMDLLAGLARQVGEPISGLPAWRRCREALAELDRNLREHHRTENEVLFPRALETERRLP